MKKFKKILLSFMTISCLVATPVFAKDVTTTSVSQSTESLVDSRKVSSTGIVSLKKGASFDVSFNMKNGIVGTPHNAFNVKISNVEQGSYTVLIKGSDGYSYNPNKYYTSDASFETVNCKDGVTYTVTIKASTSGPVEAEYAITSYIK